jgi:3-methylcrotonyl-CoA carboxylase beta subunit
VKKFLLKNWAVLIYTARFSPNIEPHSLNLIYNHCTIQTSGVTDHLALNDSHALLTARRIVSNLNLTHSKPAPLASNAPPPLYSPSEIGGVVGDNLRKPFDVREVIARVVDGSRFQVIFQSPFPVPLSQILITSDFPF